MELQLRWEQDVRLVLTCSGEIGWDAVDLLNRRVGEALKTYNVTQVIVNIEAVEFVTSVGIGALLQFRKLVEYQGGRMVIAGAAPMIAQLFATIGLDRHIPVLASLDEARRLLEQACCAAPVTP
jgi:anti-anti-sigma factor